MKKFFRGITVNKFFWVLRAIIYKPFMGRIGKKSYIGKPINIAGFKNIYLGDDVHIYPGCRIEAIPVGKTKTQIKIGDGVRIAQNVEIYASRCVVIGNNVQIGPNCVINDSKHGYMDSKKTIEEQGLEVDPVEIGDNTWISSNAIILPGVKIGKHCIVGANCVIDHNLEDNTITQPAKIRSIKIPEKFLKRN